MSFDVAAYQKEYHSRPEIIARKRAYYWEHREQVLANNREWYRTHKSQKYESRKAWMAAHPEKLAAWKAKNPEKSAIYSATYRAKHPNARYNLSRERRLALLAAQDNRCAICRVEFGSARALRPHIDHDHRCCSGNKSCGNCIRGLLCSKCNGLLLSALESPLRATAEAYLRKNNA
jgi:hypothetical protein